MTDTTTLAAIDRTALKNALDAVMSSASADETRPHLAGVLLETIAKDNVIRFVSTDGHRLTRLDVPALPDSDTVDSSHLLPYREAKALIGVLRSKGPKPCYLEPIEIKFGSGRVTFEHVIDGSSTAIKPADEQFPPYSKVIPDYETKGSQGTPVIGWNARYMADVQKVAKHFANEKSGGVKASFGGDRDPVRIDMDCAAGKATVVIMPMRI